MFKSENFYLDLPVNQKTIKYKLIAYLTLFFPFCSFIFVILTWHKFTIYFYSDCFVFFIFYLLSTIGISVGFHRGLAHKSYNSTRYTRIFLAILGSIAAQGSALFWVATHRRHHVYSDTVDDIHSPNTSSNKLFGFLYAHIIWMTRGKISNPTRFAKDLALDNDMQWISKKYLTWVILGIILPGLILMILHPSFHAFLEGVLWGGLVRIFVAHHITWSLNSIAHLGGRKEFDTADNSHNLACLSIISIGESWHNNHHAFPYSAKFGVLKGQIDIGYSIICILEKMGFIFNIKKPSVRKIESRLKL